MTRLFDAAENKQGQDSHHSNQGDASVLVEKGKGGSGSAGSCKGGLGNGARRRAKPPHAARQVEALERRSLLTATVNWTDVQQSIDGFGASSAWVARTPNAAQTDLLYSRTSGIGLSILKSHIQPNGYAPFNENVVMQLAGNYGLKIFSAAWTPPREWKTNNNTDHGGSLLPQYYQPWADTLATYVQNLKGIGVTLDYISLQNEPDYAAGWASCTWTDDQLAAFLPMLVSALQSRGLTTQILGPEMSAWSLDRAKAILATPSLSQNLAVLGAHRYGATGYPYRFLGNTLGKPFWETEIYFDGATEMDTAMLMLQDMSAAFKVGGVSAWMYWRQSGPANEGLMDSLYNPTRRFWAMGNFSRFVRPGWVMIGNTENGGLDVTTFKDPVTGKFAIVAYNTNATTGVTETFNLSGVSASSVQRYITSATAGDDLRLDQTLTLTGGTSFTSTVPAYSVVTFVGQDAAATAFVAPDNLRVAPNSANTRSQMNLNWDDNASNETGYNVERSADGTNFSTVAFNLPANTTSFTDSGLAEATTYYYRVRAVNGGTLSSPSNVFSATTALGGPGTLSLSASQPTNGFAFTWTTSSTRYTGVQVERSTDGLSWTRIATTGKITSYSDANIPGYNPSQIYCYRIRNTLGSIASSYSFYYTTISSPAGFTATASSSGTAVNLAWTNVSAGTTGVEIDYQSGSNTSSWSSAFADNPASTPTAIADTGLTENTVYRYRIAALFASDAIASAFTSTVSVTTPVATPTNLTAVSVNSATAQLNWTDNSAIETAYVVERSANGTTWTTLSSSLAANTSTFTDTSSPTGTVYYRVSALSGSVASAYARTIRLSALPVITATPSPVTGTTGALSVPAQTWGTAPLIYSWSLDSSPDTVTYSSNNTAASTSPAVTFTAAGSYVFRVTITDAAGYSSSATRSLSVNQTLTSISVTATGNAILKGTWQSLTGQGYDQFGDLLTSQPTFTWSVLSGGGSVSAAGLYQAPASAASPIVRALSGALSAQVNLSVVDSPTLITSYGFNEGSGTAVLDTLGVGVTGYLSGGVSYTTGRMGSALAFDGSTGSVYLGKSPSLDVQGQITLAAWVKPTSTTGYQVIVGRSYSRSPNAETVLRINSGKYEVGSWNGTSYLASLSIPAGDIGNWVHLVGTYDGQTWRLYRNGTLAASTTSAVGALPNTFAWRIGSTDIPDRYFNGVIDSVRIYAQPLSASDVSALYNQNIFVTAPAAAAVVSNRYVNLSVAAIDPDTNFDSLFSYTWTATGTPSQTITYSGNGNLAARNTIATLSQSGSVTFTATINDSSGRTIAQNVAVTVSQVFSSVSVTPNPATVSVSTTRQFTASALDQFALPMAPQPAFTWTATGGTVTSSGLFTAGTTAATGYRVTATSAGLSAFSNVTVSGSSPTLTLFRVNNGAAQRSKVTSLTLSFSAPVTLSSGALTLARRGTNAFSGTVITSPSSGAASTLILTFTGGDVVAGSLADGIYDLTLSANSILDAYGQPLAGSNLVQTFHRLFGDTDGNGRVDSADQAVMNAAYAFSSASPNYIPYLDYDGNNAINNTDMLNFRRRLGTNLFA